MTGEPGADCPACGRRLTSELCACGWRPASATPAQRCVDCDATSRLELDEDGELRCAACHVSYLRRRAARDPIDADELAACLTSMRTSLARWAARAAPAATSIAVFEAPGVDPGGSHLENSTS